MTQNNTNLLHPLVLKWLNKQGWSQLHEIQQLAIKPILEAKSDVIISAATASGKTEAAFLPACSKILLTPKPGIRIIYISPLKALINDQFKRLEDLGNNIGISVTPWHGDVGNNKKKKLIDIPNGILLITPESLESLLINHNNWCIESFKNVDYFVIDEFHAFIGTERGYQLLSLMHRIDFLAKHQIIRIALSATFSNINSVKSWVRNNDSEAIIIKGDSQNKNILLQIRGYDVNESPRDNNNLKEYDNIAIDIFKIMRGTSNLVFTNSRAKAEYLATILNKLSTQNNLPIEFFPHHSSLAKNLRERLEDRLKDGRFPTTAICTQTLELGIDIGDITSIAQVNAPQSVASLRQRIGRSGRRNKEAILRLFIPEISEQSTSVVTLSEHLCDETFTSVAMIYLVLEHWFEPPTKHEYALSTLVQQIISVIAQYGSGYAKDIWQLLCKNGPFNLVDQKTFGAILKCLGSKDLIIQMQDKSLTLGLDGEKLVSNYNFYSSFKAPEEYTVDFNGQKIGTLPLNSPLTIGDTFVFAGKGWEVIYLQNDKRQIFVKEYKGDTKPLTLDGNGGNIHEAVRQRMFDLYCNHKPPKFLNKIAQKHFLMGQQKFNELNLKHNHYIVGLEGLYLFPWLGDKTMHTIVQILKLHHLKAKKFGSYILVENTSTVEFKSTMQEILHSPKPNEETLAKNVGNLQSDKFDNYLERDLLCLGYGYRNFDIEGAFKFLEKVLDSKNPFNPENNAAYLT